jgi:hypothetical protein
VERTKAAEDREAVAGWARDHFEALKQVLDEDEPGYGS